VSQEEPPARRLRLAVAGCRYFTGPAASVARAYDGLAEVLEVPCEIESDRPDAHLEEPERTLTPAVVERLRRDPPDVVVVPPGHRGAEPGIAAERIVPVMLEPLCLLEPTANVPKGPLAVVVRPALVSSVLVAALLDRSDRWVYLPFVSVEHLRSQLGVARRAGVAVVVTEPAAVPIAAEVGLAPRSFLDPPSRCVVVHAVERALARAVLQVLRRQTHLPTGDEVLPSAPVGVPFPVGAGVVGEPGSPEVLALRSGRRFVVVPQSSTTYVTSLGGVVTAYTDAGRFWTNQTLAEMERRLDPRRFLRIDQSHLVNLGRVAELVPWTHQRYRLVCADTAKTELVLSRDVGRRLRTALGW
jgi:DNA-binding LytR/AlgR family response regulator